MQIRVKIVGALNKPFGKDDFEYEIDEKACLEDLMLRMGYHRNHLRFILPSVNGAQRPLGHLLAQGDEVTLFLPTSGG